MTFERISDRFINFANVTYAEWVDWTEVPHTGERYEHLGLLIHFVGGTRVRLEGRDALSAAQKIGLDS